MTEAIRDPRQRPEGALFRPAIYDDGSDEMFLARLRRDLYPDAVARPMTKLVPHAIPVWTVNGLGTSLDSPPSS